MHECDVLVVGGGTAGAVAAIQAARAGARTVLVEMTGQVGGTMTSGGVSAVAYSLYFIDVRNAEGTHQEFLPEDRVPTIPFGALVPRGSRHLLAAGRVIASDRRAHSALRVEASCMAMGQAVGAAAALGVHRGMASRDVPLTDLRALLREHGAIVPLDLVAAPG